ncbi:hypothetical protein DM10_04780 [Borreliella garinii]|nr:hypothetical protein DM10_04780 [Borreliella garinii]
MIYDYNYFSAELSGELKNSFEDIKASSELKLSLDFPYLLQEAGIGIKYYKKFKENAIKKPWNFYCSIFIESFRASKTIITL